ncbi:MAG: right-handed parallel beta-helix repeat-containing protein [Chloroflexi bacterium]|nr:right-handed parallel beta-helix repeat-containing protein [Chloroflexota bacterium]
MLISQRVNTILLVLILAAGITIVAMLATEARGGPLDPPGAPSSTLPLVEPRTPIRQPASAAGFPIAISAPGSYYLAENITGVVGKAGIEITASGVTLDLNGFTLTGAAGSADGIATATVQNLSIGHGTVRNWGSVGIYADFAYDSTYEDLRLYGNIGEGVRASGNSLISHVVSTGNGGHGILLNNAGFFGGIIRDSTAARNALDGIQVLGRALVIENASFTNGGSQIHAINTGNRIDSNNVAGQGALAIQVDHGSNVIVRNSIQGAPSAVSIVGGNTVGPLETAATPLSNPWANILY